MNHASVENGRYTTIVETANGKRYDLGLGQRVPGKCGSHADETTCHKCLVTNAWTQLEGDK